MYHDLFEVVVGLADNGVVRWRIYSNAIWVLKLETDKIIQMFGTLSFLWISTNQIVYDI